MMKGVRKIMENEPTNNNEIAPVDHSMAQYGTGLNMAQVKWVGQVFYKSGMFADTGDEAQAMVKIMAGQELGLAPFAAMNGINIIKGRPTMSGNLIASAVKKHKLYDYRVVKSDANECIIDWFEKIDGKSVKTGTNAFTMEMARNAGLAGDNWRKYPQAMLFNRAVSAGQKIYAPDVFVVSVYTPEEIEGLDAPQGYIPAKSVKPSKPVIIDDESTTLPAGNDVPFEDTPAAPVEAETISTSTEIVDEETERPIATTTKRVVDAEFKKKVRKTLDALELNPTERLRLLKNSTGRVSLETLKDQDWLKFSDAIDDMMIAKADDLTAAETPVENNGGENETETQNQNDDAPADS
jgi:hypothetical protein